MISFIHRNNVELLRHRTIKHEDDTYGSFVAASLKMMLSPKGADLDAPRNWHVRCTTYKPNETQENSIGDDFEEGEETVNTIKGLVSSICTLGKA